MGTDKRKHASPSSPHAPTPPSPLPRGVVLKTAAIRGGRRTYVLARPMRIVLSRESWVLGRQEQRPTLAQTPAPGTSSVLGALKTQDPRPIVVSIEIPEGFETDFASIPRILWPLFPPDGPWLEASIVHDYCYREQVPFSRFFADALFRELMARYGVPRWRRVLFYYAVRLCGWLWWRK